MFKKRIALLVSVAVAVSLFAGCGKNTVPEVSDTGAVTEESAGEEVEAETEEQEEETDEQVAEEVEKVAEGPQTVGQWSMSLDTTEPKLTIWNDVTKEGTIIENEKEYSIDENCMLVICTKEGSSTIGTGFLTYDVLDLDSSYSTSIYWVIGFAEFPSEPTKVEINLVVDEVDYGDYTFYVTTGEAAEREVVEVPEGYEYYLTGGLGKNVLGFNVPEDYSVDFVINAVGSLYCNSNTDTIAMSLANAWKDIYEGVTDTYVEETLDEEENVESTTTSTFVAKGTQDTIYGSAHLYDETTYCKYEKYDFTMHEQVAIIKVNGDYIRISSHDGENYPTSAHDITWVLQQLFE